MAKKKAKVSICIRNAESHPILLSQGEVEFEATLYDGEGSREGVRIASIVSDYVKGSLGLMVYEVNDDYVRISSLGNATHKLRFDPMFKSAAKVRGVGTALVNIVYAYGKPIRVYPAYSSHFFYAKMGFIPTDRRPEDLDDFVGEMAQMIKEKKTTSMRECVEYISTHRGYVDALERRNAMIRRLLGIKFRVA